MLHDIDSSIQQLLALRSSFASAHPGRPQVPGVVQHTLALLFPHFGPGGAAMDIAAMTSSAESLRRELLSLIGPVIDDTAAREKIVRDLFIELPALHSALREDAEAIYRGDPAARNVDEVILAYPGFFAIAVYRLAHWLHERQVATVPRMMTEFAHQLTGIDIHPGATIGKSFVIDHGTGIVIGETTVIEDNVKLYQGVTLGALSVEKSLADTKRHPTIERGVVIYANATILGGRTVIGAESIVGGNVWLTASVPPGSRVYHRADVTVKGSS
jgi:serine O-acetyltransferase